MDNNFVWCDLSTFDIEKAKNFYSKIFDWQFDKTNDQSMDEDYFIAHQNKQAIAAIFTMPQRLQQLNLPSFWMSYIQVEDINKTVKLAKQFENVIVEIEPTNFDDKSKIALIRDPSGAGFTVYQGPNLQGEFQSGHGHMIWNIYHGDNINHIKSFYETIFAWKIKEVKKNSFKVYDKKKTIANIDIVDSSIRGKYKYWMPVFEVNNIDETNDLISNLDGKILTKLSDSKIICSDPQGGSFIIQGSSSNEANS